MLKQVKTENVVVFLTKEEQRKAREALEKALHPFRKNTPAVEVNEEEGEQNGND